MIPSPRSQENFPGGAEVGVRSFFRGIWNGVYFAFAGFVTKTEEFGPKTLAGRCLGLLNAFAVFLYIALCACVRRGSAPPFCELVPPVARCRLARDAPR